MASIAKRADGRWRARYRDDNGREHARHFDRKIDAQRWLDETTTAVVTGAYIDPKTAKTTVEQWCATWLDGYRTRRASTVRQAEVHIAHIVRAFGSKALGEVRPSDVRSWTAKLSADGLAPSYVYALHNRFSQVMADAVHDGIVPRNPCSRRTSPHAGEQRPYVASTEQVWALHDAFPEHLAPAVLLGAFVGLRTAEVCGLRIGDVDFMRGVVSPVQQWPGKPLKSDKSQTPIPIPQELALQLAASVARWGSPYVVTDGLGGCASPWSIDRAVRSSRKRIEGMPSSFRFHDLRHYLASLLIASGADVKTVQTRLHHASAVTTLGIYVHMWPDRDESTRATISGVLAARADWVRTRTGS
ncbi:MAG: site-specific integrase [Actinomycetota bacterium]|nr:site-specific integrase [Actinomycetota bacterium]